jgi:SHS2 domain-containing protein
MPYEYVEDIATADAAFRAWGDSVEEMFAAAAEATLGVMVEEVHALTNRERRTVDLQAESVEILLFVFLQEVVFFKDAEELLLRAGQLDIQPEKQGYRLCGELQGEKIDRERHLLAVDVKAVTLYQFTVKQTGTGWECLVVLDI